MKNRLRDYGWVALAALVGCVLEAAGAGSAWGFVASWVAVRQVDIERRLRAEGR